MEKSALIKDVLHRTIESVQTVIPLPAEAGKPALLEVRETALSFGVLIGITGYLRGRLIIHGEQSVFSSIAETMYGMLLDEEMLASFTAELGNMIAGHLATALSAQAVEIDITPPTVLTGDVHMHGTSQALSLPVEIEKAGNISILFMLETN